MEVTIGIKKETTKRLDILKAKYLEKFNKNVTKKELLETALERFESEIDYKKAVEECISKYSHDNKDRQYVSFIVDNMTKAKLLKLKALYQKPITGIVECLINYLEI